MIFKKLLGVSSLALTFALIGCDEAKKSEEKAAESTIQEQSTEAPKEDTTATSEKASEQTAGVKEKVEDVLKKAEKEIEEAIHGNEQGGADTTAPAAPEAAADMKAEKPADAAAPALPSAEATTTETKK